MWAFALDSSLTPLYQKVVCKVKPPKIKKMSPVGGLYLDLEIITVCENKNPYAVSVTLSEDRMMQVFVGKKREHIANITEVPVVTIPHKGSGEVLVRAKFKLKRTQTNLFREFTIWLENNVWVQINANLLFTWLKVGMILDLECGVNMKTTIRGPQMGRMVCGKSFDELDVPPAQSKQEKEEEFERVGFQNPAINRAIMLKDVVLGLFTLLGFLMFVMCLAYGLYSLYRLHLLSSDAPERDVERATGVKDDSCTPPVDKASEVPPADKAEGDLEDKSDAPERDVERATGVKDDSCTPPVDKASEVPPADKAEGDLEDKSVSLDEWISEEAAGEINVGEEKPQQSVQEAAAPPVVQDCKPIVVEL